MNKLFASLGVLILSTGLLNAQADEISSAFKAYDKGDINEAKTQLEKAKLIIDQNAINIDPNTMSDYYFASGRINTKAGNNAEAIKSYSELSKYETGFVFTIRNKDTKKDEYYYSKYEADELATKGNYAKPKVKELSPKNSVLAQTEMFNLANAVLKQANTKHSQGRHKDAADDFLRVYDITKAMGNEDDIYKYQAALSYYNAQDLESSYKVIKELIDNDFKGIGESHPESIQKDAYVLALNILNSEKRYDPIVEKAAEKYPNDPNIATLVANIYNLSGKQDKFVNKLRENITLNPKDDVSYYNLGVMLMENPEGVEEAKGLFKKAIELNPQSKNAYTNLIIAILAPEKEYVDKINANLGNSTNDKKNYAEYTNKRKGLYVEAIPYLEKAFKLDQKDTYIVKALRQAYKVTENVAKEDEMTKIEKSLLK